MSVVAVAGGTGSIGRAIVDAIIAQGKYEVIVLGRNVCSVMNPVYHRADS